MAAQWNVGRAAVLGAGTMGARIAAHLANGGIPTCLLDLAPKELTADEQKRGLSLTAPQVRNRIARLGLEAAQKGKPAAFFTEETASLITIGNFDDHLDSVAHVDWIIEAVAENLEIKRNLWRRVAELRKPGAVASTNTSGLSVARIAAELPEGFRQHFLGTHFFNPPRYLHLVEIIPGPNTLPEVMEAVSRFADLRLGKGVVVVKDTPNFIANRIGTFCICHAFRVIQEEGLAVEEVDRLFSAVVGWPRSALFGTLDLVGLDILANVARTLLDHAPHDECRDLFLLPDFIEKMLARGLLGNKTGSGFYKRPAKASGGEMLVLDLATLEYRPMKKVEFPSLETAKKFEDAGQRIRHVMDSNGRAGRFLWKFLSQTFIYSARRIPEIADRIVDIDRAMQWGYGWELGPFELWDAVGLETSVRRMQKEGCVISENVSRMLSANQRGFYDSTGGAPRYFDFSRGEYLAVPFPPGILLLRGGPQTPPIIRKNASASLRDLGDGVACVEFHSKMNSIGPDTIEMVNVGLAELIGNFDALVIGNQGAHFSVGANLMLLLNEIHAGNWDAIDRLIRSFQQMTMGIKYAPKPVVAAPFQQTLGGGCEIALAAPRVQAGAETHIGLVETGVGLVPAAGGVKEMLLRVSDALPPGADLLPAVRELFRTISMARASSCAEDARRLGYLRDSNGITMNPDRLLADAKLAALEMVHLNYRPLHAVPRNDVRVLGEGGIAELQIAIHLARQGGFITEYDAVVAGKLAHVICGGRITGPATVSEQYLLDLEREAFVSLCREPRTQARIQHTLQTGKPLRN